MDYTAGIFARAVHGAVNGETGGIGEIGRVLLDIAVEIDFDQR